MNIMNTPKPFKGYAALSRAEPLLSFAYGPGPLVAEQVEIAVNYCGVCPADMSMIKDAWGFSSFPLVPGHDVVAVGSEALWRRYSTSAQCRADHRDVPTRR
jgi:D-arabinose 1-dehydrogenase-like Zn-dependent alcohol dehydrogenase